jgi:hypothetical protein
MSVGLQSVRRGDGWYVYSFREVTRSNNVLRLVTSLVLVNEHRRCGHPGIRLDLSSRKSVRVVGGSAVYC